MPSLVKRQWLTCKQDDWAGRTVPPPTVPTSMEGMVHETRRSAPSRPHGSISVRQLELPTFWAGSYRQGGDLSETKHVLPQPLHSQNTSRHSHLSSCYVNGSHSIGRVCIEATHRTSHCRPN